MLLEDCKLTLFLNPRPGDPGRNSGAGCAVYSHGTAEAGGW
jgi:hypothetical protein